MSAGFHVALKLWHHILLPPCTTEMHDPQCSTAANLQIALTHDAPCMCLLVDLEHNENMYS